MIMYDNKQGMQRCLFLDDEWSCLDCDFRIAGICDEQFYKKYGRFENEDMDR